MDTLFQVVVEIERLGAREAIRWSNGLRTWQWSYRDLYLRLAAFAEALQQRGIKKGDRIMSWGENRPEWIAAFWGAVVRGVEVVPVDFRFSTDLVQRIERESKPKLLVHGGSVDARPIGLDRMSFDELGLLREPPR